MKKWVQVSGAAVAVWSCLLVSEANAADEGMAVEQKPSANGEVLIDPLSMAFGSFGAEIGVGVTEVFSVNAAGLYSTFGFGGSDVTSWGALVGGQVFLSGQLYHGWYLYPRVQLMKSTAREGNEEAEATLYGAMLLGGYQWDWKPFTLRLGFGLRYVDAAISDQDADVQVGFTGVLPTFDTSLGVSF